VIKKEGTGKISGKPYLFYAASVVDEDGNVFAFNLSDSLVATPENIEALMAIRQESVLADVNFRPKGFDVGATIEALHAPAK